MVIMDSSTTAGDNTTVVAGPSESGGKRRAYLSDEHSVSDTTKHEKHTTEKQIPNDFVRAADYALEDRQFFVVIGHDGLIGALQKLDKQLLQVRGVVSYLVDL